MHSTSLILVTQVRQGEEVGVFGAPACFNPIEQPRLYTPVSSTRFRAVQRIQSLGIGRKRIARLPRALDSARVYR